MAERDDFEYLKTPLPRSEHHLVCERAAEGGYSMPTDYVRAVIARDALHVSDERLARSIAEGLESGPAEPFAPDFFDRMRERVRRAKQDPPRGQ
ncbi:MAG: hypothetical protein HZA53_15230 [Planctomycetes bacterium]|nr:hypothetical protein [Planctomycetota bacterium]